LNEILFAAKPLANLFPSNLHPARLSTIFILAISWAFWGVKFMLSASVLLFHEVSHTPGFVLIALIIISLALGLALAWLYLLSLVDHCVDEAYKLGNENPRNAHTLLFNCCFGWFKVLGFRGLTVTGLMIGLGILLVDIVFLGGLVNSFIRSPLLMALGTAFLSASMKFFTNLKSAQ